MSSADLFEDGFPHGTRDGYERGCRGHGSCPGVLDFGRSCSQASMSYAGDYTYRQRVDAGKTPAEIAELERADGVKPAKAPVKTTEISTATVTVADSETPLGELADLSREAEAELAAIPAEVGGIPLEKHGTTAGYSMGCRLRDECPAKATTGVSCANAVAAKQREAKARKAAEGGAVSPQEAVEVPVEREPVVAEIVSEAVEEPVPEAVPGESGTRVRAEGLLTELADAKERIGDLELKLKQAQVDLAEVTRQRDAQHQKLSALSEEHAALNLRLHDEHAASSRRIGELEEHLAERVEERAKTDAGPLIPADRWEAAVAAPAHGASLQVRQMGDALAFDISGGGEAVRLELAFESGQLQRAAVTTGN